MQESGQSTLAHASVASKMDGFFGSKRCFFGLHTPKKERCILCIQNTVYDKQAIIYIYIYVMVFRIPHPSSLSLSLCIYIYIFAVD